MQFTQTNAPAPKMAKVAPVRETKYNFAAMVTGQGYITTDFVDAKKAAGRLTSAVASYKKRSGDARKFSVRSFKQEDGTDAVGVWVSAAPEAQVAE